MEHTTQKSNITVIIPVLGNWDYTEQCLSSLLEKSVLVDEIIVIDNDELANTAEIFFQNFKRDGDLKIVSFYTPRRNLGVSKSWDTGIKLAKNELVAVVNNDTKMLTDRWDEKLLQQWAQYPLAAAFCPWPISREEEARDNDGIPYEGLNGSFFVIDREKIRETKNFKEKGEYIDTAYTPAYWEDADLLVQLRIEGYEAYVTPRIYCIHYCNKTAGPLLPSHKGMDNPYWKNLDYFNHKYNVYIWDYFKVYMSNVQDENTGVRLI